MRIRIEKAGERKQARSFDVVRRYFDGCNSGDVGELMSTFAPDVTHYFPSSSFPPLREAA